MNALSSSSSSFFSFLAAFSGLTLPPVPVASAMVGVPSSQLGGEALTLPILATHCSDLFRRATEVRYDKLYARLDCARQGRQLLGLSPCGGDRVDGGVARIEVLRGQQPP